MIEMQPDDWQACHSRRGGARHFGKPGGTLVSVVTVVYNAVHVFEGALRSIVDQHSACAEYIVIDGDSTDGTVEFLERYDDRIDLWISEPDSGIYHAMNKALDTARGDWLIFIGADDRLLVQIDSIVERLRDPDTVYYGNVQIEETGAVSGGRFSRYRMMQENICHQAVFYPRSVYSRKRYDTSIGPLADHCYNIELRGAGVPFVHIPEVVARFSQNGISSVKDARFEEIKLAAIRRSFGLTLYLLKRLRTTLVHLLKPRRHVTS